MRLAGREGMKIAVRSGGHSWAGNHLRDGGLLLDLSRLDARSTIDAEAMTATVAAGLPAATSCSPRSARRTCSSRPATASASRVGGYLLQGGYGWNGRVHGPACMSVEAIDVVTADGELVRADAQPARRSAAGPRAASGPGFFGVVTRFHLRVYPRPKVVANGRLPLPDRRPRRGVPLGARDRAAGRAGRWS